MLKKLGWAFLFFLGIGVIGSAIHGISPDTTVPARPSGPSYSPYLVKMMIKSVLRDPDSATFGSMNTYDDRKLNGIPVTVVCGSVNAKNGFGGYTGSKDFVFVTEPPAILIDTDTNNSKFVKLWNSLCAGKHTR